MDDPDIVSLCQRIYKNHRQALQLIYEHAGSPAAGLIGKIEEIIGDHPGGWHIVNTTSKEVLFIPNTWFDLLPAIGKRSKFDPRCWLVLRFQISNNKVYFNGWTMPTTDPELHEMVNRRLTDDPEEFGFLRRSANKSDQYTQFGTQVIGRWSEDDGPDEEAIYAKVGKKLGELVTRLKSVPDALRPVIEAREKSEMQSTWLGEQPNV